MPAIKSTNALHAYLNAGWVDLTTDVQEKASLSANWGIDGSGPLDIVGDIGELRFTLRNDDGKYYPDGGSPLSGWGWGVPIKVTMAYGGNTRTLRYYVEDIKLNVGKVAAQSTVTVTALDWFKFAQEHPISAPSVEINKTADEGITTLLGLVSPAPQATDLDTGAYTFKAIFDSVGMRGNAYTELVKLAVSEYGHLYLKKDATNGETLAFENATSRNSGAIAATINAAIDDVELHYGENIINRATATAYPKRFDTDPQILYSLARSIPIRAGETLPSFRVKYIDPTGGGRPVHALVDTMRTPQVPGGTDTALMALLNFRQPGIEADVTDETGRHTWVRGDVSTINDTYYDAGAKVTRITGGVFGPYAILGGYNNYKITAPSSTDFDPEGGAMTWGWFENRLNPVTGRASFTRNLGSAYPPYVMGVSDGTNILINMSSDGATWDIADGKSLGKLTRARWVYYEVNLDSDGWFYAFNDGELTDKWYSATAIPNGSDSLSIGCWKNNIFTFMGLDSFFVRKGECLHTTNFDPPRRQISPTYDGDYLLNTAEDGTGTDLSDQLSINGTYDATGITYALTNNSAQDAFVIHIQAVGKGVYAEGTLETYVEDAASIASYNYREISLDQKYQQSLNAGTSIITSIIAAEKDPRTELRAVSFYANKSTTTMENCLLRDVGDLISVAVSDAGVDNYYHIQNINISIKAGGIIYVTWGLKPAYSIDPDFAGGGGGGGDGDDGLVGVGGDLGGFQKGIYQGQYLETMTITTTPIVTLGGIYQEQYLEELDIVGYVEKHNLLSIQHIDTTAADPVRGDVITGQGATPKWVRLAASIPAANLMNVLAFINGTTEPAWRALFDATNPTTIAESAAASPGTAVIAAHRDHTHGAPATWTPTAHNQDASTITYTPTVATDWDGDADPGDLDDALNQLAERVDDVEGAALGAHKDSHDPNDGSDPLDTAAPSELASVQAAGVGTSHSLARADHQHQIQHSIADNHIVTIDGTTNANEYARFTASGIVGRTESEFKSDFNLEIGTDVQAYNSQLSIHKIAKTVLNPQIVYGLDTQIIVFRAPANITITRIHISGNDSSPGAELDIDLKWADNTTAWTNATRIDLCDTSSGVKTITSGFDDATVASGKYIYWEFGTEPHEDWTQFYFEIYYTFD